MMVADDFALLLLCARANHDIHSGPFSRKQNRRHDDGQFLTNCQSHRGRSWRKPSTTVPAATPFVYIACTHTSSYSLPEQKLLPELTN